MAELRPAEFNRGFSDISTEKALGVIGALAGEITVEAPSPVHGLSTVTIDGPDGTPGTRFWVLASDRNSSQIMGEK